jgi:hypothetical protein
LHQAQHEVILKDPGIGHSNGDELLIASVLLYVREPGCYGHRKRTTGSEPPGTVPEHSAADLLAFDPSLVGDSPRVFHRAIASNLHRKMWGQSPG